MKFTVNKTTLYDALQVASKAIGKNVIPALENFLFTISGKTLTISGSNMEVWISTKVQLAEAGKVPSMMVPSSRILGLLRELPETDLHFTIEKKTTEDGKRTFYNTTIKAGKGKFTIPCDPGEDFPSMNAENMKDIEIDGTALLSAIENTLFATAKDGINVKLNGVCVTISSGNIAYAGCDGFVLSAINTAGEFGADIALIIPNKALSILQGMPIPEKVMVQYNDRNISFELADDTTVKSVLIDDKYPHYKNIIPTANDKLVAVKRADLIGAIKRTGQFANSISHAVKLEIKATTIVVSSRNDYGESATEEVDCVMNGDPIDIWINGTMTLPILSRLIGDTVYMHLSKPNRAIVFKSDDSEVDVNGDLMLIMPVMGVN